MIEEETKSLTKFGETDSNETVTIPVFDIHSKNIGNGNGTRRITTNVYAFRCHPDNSNIFKALLVRFPDDMNNTFHFIPFGLPQLITIATYRHHIKIQNSYLASMYILPIHSVTKSALKDKVEEKLLKVVGIPRLEEAHVTKSKGKWLVFTNKSYKSQVKREVDRILKGVML